MREPRQPSQAAQQRGFTAARGTGKARYALRRNLKGGVEREAASRTGEPRTDHAACLVRRSSGSMPSGFRPLQVLNIVEDADG